MPVAAQETAAAPETAPDTAAAPDAVARDAPIATYEPLSVTRDLFDSMPQEYRKSVIRLMAIQAYGEKMACVLGTDWIGKAPGFRQRRVYANIVSDEARHSALLFRELEALGVGEVEAVDIALRGAASSTTSKSLEGPNAVGDAANEWIDIVCNLMFLDRAGRLMIENYCTSSYRPWARACLRILPDEAMHEAFGVSEFRALLAIGADRAMMREKATRWYAYSLNFFGPPSSHTYERLRDYGIKRSNNEEMRSAYRRECATVMAELGAPDLLCLTSDGYPYA